jgi:hypothetical protein
MAPDPPEIPPTRLQELGDAALALRFTAVDDRPAGDAALLDALDDELATLLATIQEAVTAAAAVPRAPTRRQARAARRRCHALVDEVASQLARIGAAARRQERHDLAAERGPEWRAWTAALDQDLDRCEATLRAVRPARGR